MEVIYVFIFMAIVTLLNDAPWLAILLLVGIVALFIALMVKAGSNSTSSGGSYPIGSSDDSDEIPIGTGSQTAGGYLYEGRSASGPVRATYRDGHIFEGLNTGSMSFIKASYTNGYVYKGTVTSYMGTVLGRYENGYIYRGSYISYSNVVGRYEHGSIYRGNGTYDTIGTYTGDDAGGAAAAIACLFGLL